MTMAFIDLKKENKKIEKSTKQIFDDLRQAIKRSCPYTCLKCGHKTGLSAIEPRHDCKKPMFTKEGYPIDKNIQ